MTSAVASSVVASESFAVKSPRMALQAVSVSPSRAVKRTALIRVVYADEPRAGTFRRSRLSPTDSGRFRCVHSATNEEASSVRLEIDGSACPSLSQSMQSSRAALASDEFELICRGLASSRRSSLPLIWFARRKRRAAHPSDGL